MTRADQLFATFLARARKVFGEPENPPCDCISRLNGKHWFQECCCRNYDDLARAQSWCDAENAIPHVVKLQQQAHNEAIEVATTRVSEQTGPRHFVGSESDVAEMVRTSCMAAVRGLRLPDITNPTNGERR